MSEVTAIGAVFLGIFWFSLLGFYVAIRRKLISVPSGGLLSAVISTVSLVLFGLTSDTIDDGLGVVGGVGVGIAFTGMMVVIASFFKNNQPETLQAYDDMVKQRTPEQNQE